MRRWWIAPVLVVSVLLAHHSANWLAAGSRFTPAAVFYMLQALGAATLAGCLLHYVMAEAPSFWRRLSVYALVVWIIESAQLPVCRLAVADINAIPRDRRTNLCDYVTGLPVGDFLLVSEILVLAVILGMWVWTNGDGQ